MIRRTAGILLLTDKGETARQVCEQLHREGVAVVPITVSAIVRKWEILGPRTDDVIERLTVAGSCEPVEADQPGQDFDAMFGSPELGDGLTAVLGHNVRACYDNEQARESAEAIGSELGTAVATCEGAKSAPPASGTDAPPPLVVLGKRGDEPTVNGKRKKRLTTARYDVVNALLVAGDDGLSKDSLATESGHGDGHRILGRLAKSDSDWELVIQMAGEPGGRYRIRQNLPTSPDISRRAPTKRKKG